jgi:hypothetical protein
LKFYSVIARTEGLGLNAIRRIFNLTKNTVLKWERRLSAIEQVLLLYALLQQFPKVIIEGDEVYTRQKTIVYNALRRAIAGSRQFSNRTMLVCSMLLMYKFHIKYNRPITITG